MDLTMALAACRKDEDVRTLAQRDVRLLFSSPCPLQIRVVTAARPCVKSMLKRILQSFGIEPSLRMIQTAYIISKLNSDSFDPGIALHIPARSVYKKAKLLREIRSVQGR